MSMVIEPIEGPLGDLLEAWDSLAERERRALVLVATRMLAGQKLFGEFTYAKKDWKREASEEAFDMAVYLAALLVDKEDEKGNQ